MIFRCLFLINSLLLSSLVFAEPLLSPVEEKFLKRHWTEIIPLQGKAPSTFSELEKSLSPQSCGTCHPKQLKDWQTSLHCKAMGPGVFGQLVDMVNSDPDTTKICWSCHSPLTEQQDKQLITIDDREVWQSNKQFNPSLQQQGLVCVACHVRQHQIFGPVKSSTTHSAKRKPAHNGFTAQTAFSKSGFCRSCHQFSANDYSLNGKLVENTYNEWKESQYAKSGVQCQSCHMPNRKHLWQGIHNLEMVKKGVDISIVIANKSLTKGDSINASIIIANTGVGHYFPTYVTPRVIVRAKLVNALGQLIIGTEQEAIIARGVTLDLSQELYDTRIAPNDSRTISYQQLLTEDNLSLQVEVIVEPDYFYALFYTSKLATDDISERGRTLLKKALHDAKQSSFSLYKSITPL